MIVSNCICVHDNDSIVICMAYVYILNLIDSYDIIHFSLQLNKHTCFNRFEFDFIFKDFISCQ